MKSFKSVFRSSKKKDKQPAEATAPADPIKHSIPSPSPSSTHLPEIPATENHSKNGNSSSSQSIGHHSNASTISRAGGTPRQEAALPPVPIVPSTYTTDSSSVVDLAGLAQPQSPAPTPAMTASGTPSQQASPVVPPANPQLVQNSPLVSSLQQQIPLEADLADFDTRPTEHDPRSPHAVQPGVEPESTVVSTAAAAVAATESSASLSTPTVEEEDALQTNNLPPSYNSLNIPLPGNIHPASAPSPNALHSSAQDSVVVENSPLATSPAMSYVAPPPASPMPNPLENAFQAASPSSVHSQQHHSQQQPWAAQQAYSPAGGSQHYTHRPYVMPGSENQTYPIIMAIDWGTTYSSMAYAYQQDGEVHEVSTW